VDAQPVERVDCDIGAARSASEGPRGYRLRGDRCEGTFNREVSGSSFRVAGFYKSFGAFDSAESTLPLTWSAPDTGVVHLRVRSLQEGGELYGMDTQLLPGTTSFAWPTDFVRVLRLEPAQLGPSAYLVVEDKEMYLPLRTTPASADPTSYTLTLLSVERMDRLFVTVAPVDRVGDLATGDFVVVNQPVPRALYTSGRPIPVTIAGLKQPGLYVAHILGLTSDGDRRELNVWFYHDHGHSADPAHR
jgi:hypothetical protein